MFTVLIQNQQSANSFYEYLPLFSDAQQQDDLAVCLWNEQGKTIEESLPELHALTDSKEAWRAVIVRYCDGPVLQAFDRAEDNPYDFRDPNNPLSRLCQQLSAPVGYFNRERAAKAQGQGIVPFNGLLPESITLITLRNTDCFARTPQAVKVLENTDFVERNNYPSNCRFTVSDRTSQGPFQKIRDDLEFWNLVLLLARESLDSSFLQAYKLHGLSCNIDLQEMEHVLKNKYLELEQAERQVERFLENRSVYLEDNKAEYPDYTAGENPFTTDIHNEDSDVSTESFIKLSSDPQEQYDDWMIITKNAQENLLKDWKQFPDLLQERMPLLQRRKGYELSEVSILSESKKRQLEDEVSDLRKSLINKQGSLPEISNTQKKELEEKRIEAGELIRTRAPKDKVFLWCSALTAVGAGALIPAWIYVLFFRGEGLWITILFTLVILLVPVITSFWIVLKEKKDVSAAISAWKSALASQQKTLYDYMKQYSEYLEDVLSYRAGRSYLEQMERKIKIRDEEIKSLEAFRRDLIRFEKLIQQWAKAMGISLSAESLIDQPIRTKALFDPEIQQKYFLFEQSAGGECEINRSGRKIRSTFLFIKGLEIWKIDGRGSV